MRLSPEQRQEEASRRLSHGLAASALPSGAPPRTHAEAEHADQSLQGETTQSTDAARSVTTGARSVRSPTPQAHTPGAPRSASWRT